MASLKKPESCECGSDNLYKLNKPERWVCTACLCTVAERNQRNDPNKCRECDVKREDAEFVPGKNLCTTCKSRYNSQYREENRDKINASQKEWQEKNKERYRKNAREYYQKNMRNWLNFRFCSIKRAKISIIKGPMRSRNPASLDIQIDLDHLMQLYKDQDGKCAISGLDMTHKMDCLFSASVDRKDGSAGYIPGNVQLVCKAVNMAKGNSSDESITSFLEAYFQKRYSDVLYSESPDQ